MPRGEGWPLPLRKEILTFHIFAVERLLLAIRKDVGHKNRNLKQGDLLSIFINDIDSFLEVKK